jgi:hypothetical protein
MGGNLVGRDIGFAKGSAEQRAAAEEWRAAGKQTAAEVLAIVLAELGRRPSRL